MKQISILLITLAVVFACKKKNDDVIPDPENPTPSGLDPNLHLLVGTEHFGYNDNSSFITSDNNVIVSGWSHEYTSIMKVAPNGAVIWRKEFKDFANVINQGITGLNGDIYVSGTIYDSPLGGTSVDVYVMKLNASGDSLWTKTYVYPESESASQIITTKDGNLLIAGVTYGASTDYHSGLRLMKISPDGDLLWQKRFSEISANIPIHVTLKKNGDYLITGASWNGSGVGPYDLHLACFNSEGTKLWDKKIGPKIEPTTNSSPEFSVIELSNGELMVAGSTNPTSNTQVSVIKTDASGNEIWQKQYGADNASENAISLKENMDGSVIISGTTYYTDYSQKCLLMKVDPTGEQIWLKQFGDNSSGHTGITNLMKTSSGDNIITGEYFFKMFISTVDNNGIFK